LAELRSAIAGWYRREHHVDLDPDTEVAVVPGTRAAITLVMASTADAGEQVLIPEPGYPDYLAAAALCRTRGVPLPLDPSGAYQPDWSAVRNHQPSLVILNYPANPCAVCERTGTFETAVEYCESRRAWLMHDFAYGYLTYGAVQARSVLEVDGARELAVELWSASKIFGMAGWRIGFAVGNSILIQRIKRLVDQYVAGIWPGLQDGLLAALRDPAPDTSRRVEIYRQRRDGVMAALATSAIWAAMPEATFYIWCQLPRGVTPEDIANRCRIVGAPGSAFGRTLDGWMRISLTATDKIIDEVASRLSYALV
jgi:aminotransferase